MTLSVRESLKFHTDITIAYRAELWFTTKVRFRSSSSFFPGDKCECVCLVKRKKCWNCLLLAEEVEVNNTIYFIQWMIKYWICVLKVIHCTKLTAQKSSIYIHIVHKLALLRSLTCTTCIFASQMTEGKKFTGSGKIYFCTQRMRNNIQYNGKQMLCYANDVTHVPENHNNEGKEAKSFHCFFHRTGVCFCVRSLQICVVVVKLLF